MFTEAYRFGQKFGGERSTPGILRCIDTEIHEAHVLFPSSGLCHTVRCDAQYCSEALQQIAVLDDGVVRVECDAELQTRRLTCFRVCVDAAALRRSMAGNGFRSEEHLVNLTRSVLHELRVAVPTPACGGETAAGEARACPRWSDDVPLFAHQEHTVAWMRAFEARVPVPVAYDRNVRLTDDWAVDTARQCITSEPCLHTVKVRGGICADVPGTGKTAAALRLVLETAGDAMPPTRSRYRTRATLLVLPINLIAQWYHEIAKFTQPHSVRVVSMINARDLRGMDMDTLCSCTDIVITTFHFLRSCRAYTDMIESALGGRPRTRATLSAWGRQEHHREPLLEAVAWRRIVVDELHETFERARDVRLLNLFETHVLWGLSGTPVMSHENAQQMYLLLAREETASPHHPNLLNALVAEAVRCHSAASSVPGLNAVATVERVHLTAEETLYLGAARDADLATVVRRSTFCDEALDDALDSNNDDDERAVLARKLDAYTRARDVLLRTHQELLRTLEADKSLRHLVDMHARELSAADARVARERDRLELIGSASAPGDAEAAALQHQLKGTGGSRLQHIGEFIHAHGNEPLVLFVQWKTMFKGMRAFLRSSGVPVLVLDGNSMHRAATLQEFRTRGVLLLCMEECFSGLHLPHVKTIVFAHAIVADVLTVQRLEEQALARCLRNGQTDNVRVVSFIVADGAEERLWNDTHR